MPTCDVCAKEVDEREICGYLDGRVCIKCGYRPGESKSESDKVANISMGTAIVMLLILFFIEIFI